MKILALVGYNKEKFLSRLRSCGYEVIPWENKISLSDVQTVAPDWCISYNYKYIVGKEILEFLKYKVLNLHISYLPWNRGAHPNLWSFVENTPKGVSVHIMDEGIDTGDIVARKLVVFEDENITLRESYEMLQEEVLDLFFSIWPQVVNGNFKGIPQSRLGQGTFHRVKDFVKIKGLLEPELWDLSVKELKRRLNERGYIKSIK